MRFLSVLLVCIALSFAPDRAECQGVVIVRHAEKVADGSRDPDLTGAGRTRAEALAEALAGAPIDGLIATQYRRTQRTLSALARDRALNVEVVPAESGHLQAHVDAVVSLVQGRQDGGFVVVAGHSNTVPLIVEALSGRPVPAIDESEYDRMFILVPAQDGLALVASRYGARSGE